MVTLNDWPSLLLLLAATMSVAADPTTHCPDRPEPRYWLGELAQAPPAHLQSSAGALGPLYEFARLFVRAVQPNDFTLDFISQISQNENQAAEVLRYEAGYVVCLILAVLYMVTMVTIGGVLAWQRFFHVMATGGQLSSLSWYQQNTTVITSLSVVVILLLPGVILTFTTNSKMRESVHPTMSYIRNDVGIIGETVASVPQKVESIIDKFSVFQKDIVDELNGVGDFIGETIMLTLESALNSLNQTVQDATGAQRHLLDVQETRANMQAEYRTVKEELGSMQDRLRMLQHRCVQDCGILHRTDLETDADYSKIPSVDDMVTQLSFASDFNDILLQAETVNSTIPEMCTNQTAPQMQGLLVVLTEIRMALRNYSRQLPSFTFLSQAISQLQTALDKVQAVVDYYDYIRWSVSVVICTLILIIVLLMLAGLTVGVSMVTSPSLFPSHLQDRLRLTAVDLLHAAAGMTFAFSWLFIIMVFVNLLFGGNVHTLFCRSWTNGLVFKMLDSQGYLFSGSNAGGTGTTTPTPEASGSNKLPFSTLEIYQGCESGSSLFYSMRMNETFNIDEFLNASQYLKGIGEQLQSLTVEVSGVSLLSKTARITVERFKDHTHLNEINYTDFQALLSRAVVKTDLGDFADALEKAANQSGNGLIKVDLIIEAITARHLASAVQRLNSSRTRMSTSINALAKISREFRENAAKTLSSADEVETELQLQVPGVVQNASRCVMARATELMNQYLRTVQHVILDEVLGCRWLPVSLSNIYTAACENLIGPWNAFWLCLGWCCALLLPGVIFSVLAARLWQPNRTEALKTPDVIADKAEPHCHMTTDATPGTRKDMKINANMYLPLDEVIGADEGKTREKVNEESSA